MKTRQPLSRALVSATGWAQLPADLVTELISEINVMAIEDLAATNQDLVEISAKANFRELGKRYGKQTPAIATLIGANDPRALVDQLETTGAAELDLDGQAVTVTATDVVVTQRPRQGWAVATDSGETVALDLTLTAELRSLGLARDVVREVQEARKNQGFEVTDRIALRWEASDDATASALREYSEVIAGEVLATEFGEGSLTGLEATQVADLELTFSITRA